MNTNVVILAAGLGTRMRSKRAKVLHRAGGLALIEHVVAAARAVAPPERMVIVTGHQAAEVEELLAPLGIAFRAADGAERHRSCGRLLRETRWWIEDGLLMVLYGDTPLLIVGDAVAAARFAGRSDAAATLITTTLDDPTGYGRVLTGDDGIVQAIVEDKACTAEQRQVRVINSGIYCFRAELLWKHLGEIAPDNPAKEFYLTDMAEILARHGHKVRAMHVDDLSELLGINTRIELADADRMLRRRKTR